MEALQGGGDWEGGGVLIAIVARVCSLQRRSQTPDPGFYVRAT